MACTVTKKENKETSEITLSITVPTEDYAQDLQKAAARLSERSAIKGFRKGKAPYAIVARELGDMAILQEALETIVHRTYYQAVVDEKLSIIGMPQIDVQKLAPGNDVVFTATVALLPRVTLPNIGDISVSRNIQPVTDEQVTETVDALRSMHANEVIKDGAATKEDKVVLDMDMTLDGVAVDGGSAKDYQVYLSEDHYIPGFNDQIVGLKKGDAKTFSLSFPKAHYQKQLAGKTVDFSVVVKEVYQRTLPELTDDFAKKLGQKDAVSLRSLIKSNLEAESRKKAEEKAEIEILEQLIEKTTFDALPSILLDSERQKMFYELQRDLERNGVSLDQYLQDIKKNEKELFEDFKEQAAKRAKAALVSRQTALDNDIQVENSDIDAEIDMMTSVYKDNPEYLENLKQKEVRDSIASSLLNRKVMQWLKAKVLGEELMQDEKLSEMGCKDCKNDPNHEHKHEEKSEKAA